MVVYYSGHGVPGLDDKRGYLLPIDADPDFAELNGYALDDLLGNIEKLGAQSVTIFLDACFAGDSTKGMLIKRVSGIRIDPKAPRTKTKTVLITAAQGDQVARWDETKKHGLFTAHLLDALHGKADTGPPGNDDGEVTLAEVEAFVDRQVSRAARRNFRREQRISVAGDRSVVLVSFSAQ